MINKTLRFILGLTFLPERARRWIFGTGTRVVEVLNLTLLTTLSVLFWFDHGEKTVLLRMVRPMSGHPD